MDKFLYALGIRHVGEQTALALARHFRRLDAIKNASREELQAIEDIGEVVAESIYNYFHDEKNLRFLNKLFAQGVTVKDYRSAAGQQQIAEKILS